MRSVSGGRIRPLIRGLLALLLLFPMAGIRAAETPPGDLTLPCTLELAVRTDGGASPGFGRAAVLRVAEWETGGGAPWRLTEAYSACALAPEGLEDNANARELARYTLLRAIPGREAALDEHGRARFDGLSAGLYLVMQTERAPGYAAFDPFLVTLPLLSGAGDVWLRTVTAYPKTGRVSGTVRPPGPSGSMPDGSIPDGSMPDGPAPDGSIPDGPAPDGSIPDGSAPDGSIPDGSAPGGPAPDGSAPDGPAPDGSAPDGPGSDEPNHDVPPGRRLPQTGQLWWPVVTLAQAGVLLLLFAWLDRSRTRSEPRRARRACVLAGVAALSAAAVLTGRSVWRSSRAERAAQSAVCALHELIPALCPEPAAVPDEPPGSDQAPDAACVEVDGRSYLGILSFPTLELEVPVLDRCSPSGLAVAACRYAGSAAGGGLVVAGHNWISQFGRLRYLAPGDPVSLICADGTRLICRVDSAETLRPRQTEEMIRGNWSLTLFTCTPSGQERLAIRCVQDGMERLTESASGKRGNETECI